MITAERYTTRTGIRPTAVDLKMANCSKDGQWDHGRCGWCYTCEKPVLMCDCAIHNRRLVAPVVRVVQRKLDEQIEMEI